MTKTIHDIKCVEDMVGLTVDITEATDIEKKRLKDLCSSLIKDHDFWAATFKSEENYFMIFRGNCAFKTIRINNYGNEVTQLKDFLAKPKNTKYKKEKVRNWVCVSTDHNELFETEKEAADRLKELLDIDEVGYVARITSEITKTLRFQVNKYKG